MPITTPNIPVITRRYYPALSSIINLDDIPDELGFIKDGIVSLFDTFYYKDLQYSKSSKGDAAFYSLSLVSPKKIAIDIFGTGIKIVLNPDILNQSISAFPITLEYQWKVLSYLRDISNTDLSSPQEIFELALQILNVSQEQAIAQFIKEFVVPANATTSPIEQFVNDINSQYGSIWANTILAPTVDTRLRDIATQINQESGEYSTLIAFAVYILDSDPAITLSKLKTYFNSLFPQDIEAYITDILKPKFNASLKLSAGIEFPRSILIPVYDATGLNPFDGTSGHTPYAIIPPENPSDPNYPTAPNVLLTIGEALFYTNTNKKFGYTTELIFNTISPAQIGNTGLIISITNGKIDLSETTNVPEADADGRGVDFKGITVESAKIRLPHFLSPDDSPSTAEIIATDVVLGNPGGISGIIDLSPIGQPLEPSLNLKFSDGGALLRITAFNMVINQNTINPATFAAKLKLPVFDDEIAIRGSYNTGIYSLKVDSAPSLNALGMTLELNDSDAGTAPFEITFDKTKILDFTIGGTLTLPHISQPIGIGLAYNHSVPSYGISGIYNDPITLFGFELTNTEIDFFITNGTLANSTSKTTITFPGSANSFTVYFAYDSNNSRITIATTSAQTIDIGPLQLMLSDFSLTFDQQEIIDFDVNGNLKLTSSSPEIGFTSSFDNGDKSFAISANYTAPITLFGFELTNTILGINIKNGDVKGISGQTNFIFPGSSTSFQVDFSYNNSSKTTSISIASNQTIEIGPFQLIISNFNLSFNQDGVTAFDVIGSLTFPNSSQPLIIVSSFDNSNKTFTISAEYTGSIELFGFELTDPCLHINMKDGRITEILGGTKVKIPGATGDSFGVTFSYNSSVLTLSATNVSLKLGPSTLTIVAFALSFDSNGVTGFDINGTFVLNQGVSPIAISSGKNTTTGCYEVNGTSTGKLDFFGIELINTKVGFELCNDVLSGVSISSQIKFPGVEGGPLGVSIDYSNGDWHLVGTNFPAAPLTIGSSMALTFSEIDIQFNNNGITSSSIGGTITFPNKTTTPNSIGFNINLLSNGFEIVVANVAGFEIDIPNVAKLTLYELTLRRIGTTWGIELGNDTDNPSKGLLIANALNIPVVGKFLPKSVDIRNLEIDSDNGIKDTDIVIDWPDIQGVALTTGSGLVSAEIDVHKTLFKALTIDKVKISFEQKGGSGVTEAKFTLDGGLKLGPIVGAVSGVGLSAEITFPSDGSGNLGPLNIGELGIAGPEGIGLSLDGGPISGGGFLEYDTDKGRYAGTLELTINGVIAINAVGIIDTKLPGPNPPKFALLIVLTAEFLPPIQLGFGFSLNAVGGLLALHRTMDTDVLRAGVKTGALNNILFPTNVVENAPQIISDMDAAFPISKGRFIFGPMVEIGWGTPELISVQLGLLIEIPKPVRLAILGVIQAALPDKNLPTVDIKINFLGIVDFGKKSISFDASLFDSRLLAYTLSGDMAFRLLYGDNPTFLLTVGGFNPSFTPPPLNLPKLDRLTVSLRDTPELKVAIENYFAVTSNTVQFGARVSFYAKVSIIVAEGFLGFDALFNFSPFSFVAELAAAVSIAYKGKTLAAVTLNGRLEGPTPWIISGDATFKFLKIKKTFTLSPKQFGKSQEVINDTMAIDGLLIDALNDRNNWETKLVEDKDQIVQFKEIDPSVKVINGEGYLTVTQKILPLDLTIEKYGNKEVTGPDYFSIESLTVGGVTDYVKGAGVSDTRDDFAPAEYKKISKSKKLSSPSFQKMNNGVRLKIQNGGFEYGNKVVNKELKYETILLDVNISGSEDEYQRYKFDTLRSTSKSVFSQQIKGGSVSKSEQGKKTNKKKKQVSSAISYKEPQFAVVYKENLGLYNSGVKSLGAAAEVRASQPSVRANKASAIELMEEFIAENPRLKGQIQVIPDYELPQTDVPEEFVFETGVFETEVFE